MNTSITEYPMPAEAIKPWSLQQEPPRGAPFSFLYASEHSAQDRETWKIGWDNAIEHWLSSKSTSTHRSYLLSIKQFKDHILHKYNIDCIWQATDVHVQSWIASLHDEGKSDKTIEQRLSAVSSYFEYCSSITFIHNGQEISLLIDAYGNTRQNPFRSQTVERPKTDSFSDSVALPKEAYSWIIEHLQFKVQKNPRSVDAKRNLAIMLMFGFTGWRNEEVISMTYGKLSCNPDRSGQYVYKWTGKMRNGKEQKRSIPDNAYNAIMDYLQADGRIEIIKNTDYIWQPLRTHGTQNFSNVSTLSENRHISQSTVNGMMRALLYKYFLALAKQEKMDNPKEFATEQSKQHSIHSLRHMFAIQMYEASGNDIVRVSKMLGHCSLNTTQIYLSSLQQPDDNYSDLLSKRLGVTK